MFFPSRTAGVELDGMSAGEDAKWFEAPLCPRSGTSMAPMDERTLASTRPWAGDRIKVRVDEVERDDGHRSRREVVEHPGAVAVLAWDGQRLAMVTQWRHATGRELLEIPAGTLEPGEAPAETARRELAEEVGLAAASWEDGPRFYTAPGFCDELLHLFLATELHETAAGGDPEEQIEPSWMTMPDALAAIDDGRILDAKTIVGVGWLARRLPSSAIRHDVRG